MLSASHDETTRLHATWNRPKLTSWHEIARPQIHGYLINCVVSLNDDQFATGADEKVLRVFKTTQSFLHSFRNINGGEIDCASAEYVFGAEVPALGLSNRAVNDEAGDGDKTQLRPIVLDKPPTEDELMQSTLW